MLEYVCSFPSTSCDAFIEMTSDARAGLVGKMDAVIQEYTAYDAQFTKNASPAYIQGLYVHRQRLAQLLGVYTAPLATPAWWADTAFGDNDWTYHDPNMFATAAPYTEQHLSPIMPPVHQPTPIPAEVQTLADYINALPRRSNGYPSYNVLRKDKYLAGEVSRKTGYLTIKERLGKVSKLRPFKGDPRLFDAGMWAWLTKNDDDGEDVDVTELDNLTPAAPRKRKAAATTGDEVDPDCTPPSAPKKRKAAVTTGEAAIEADFETASPSAQKKRKAKGADDGEGSKQKKKRKASPKPEHRSDSPGADQHQASERAGQGSIKTAVVDLTTLDPRLRPSPKECSQQQSSRQDRASGQSRPPTEMKTIATTLDLSQFQQAARRSERQVAKSTTAPAYALESSTSVSAAAKPISSTTDVIQQRQQQQGIGEHLRQIHGSLDEAETVFHAPGGTSTAEGHPQTLEIEDRDLAPIMRAGAAEMSHAEAEAEAVQDESFGVLDESFGALDGNFSTLDGSFGRLDEGFGTLDESWLDAPALELPHAYPGVVQDKDPPASNSQMFNFRDDPFPPLNLDDVFGGDFEDFGDFADFIEREMQA